MKSIHALAALVGLAATVVTHAAVLDFAGFTPGTAVPIAQTYGDLTGLDISYRTYDPNTNATIGATINKWDIGYGDLIDVAYAVTSDAGLEIAFLPSPGYQVTLQSFDLAGYANGNQPNTTIHVVDFAALTNPVVNLNETVLGTTGSEPTHSHYDINVTTTGLLWIHVSPAYNVGIDNVIYSVTALPEPSGAAAAFAGAGLLALRRRR